MIQTKEDLKEMFEAGQVQTEAKMVDLIDSCYNDSVMPDAYEVVTTMPTTIPLGKLVLYNGTLWRGLKTGESTLAEGTPIPTRGYWEQAYKITQDAENDMILTPIKDELSIGELTLNRVEAGYYSNNNVTNIGYTYGEGQNINIISQLTSLDLGVHEGGMSQKIAIICSGSIIIITISNEDGFIDFSDSYLPRIINFIKYPPTT